MVVFKNKFIRESYLKKILLPKQLDSSRSLQMKYFLWRLANGHREATFYLCAGAFCTSLNCRVVSVVECESSLQSKGHITVVNKAQTGNLWIITRSVTRGFALRQGFSKVEWKTFLRSCDLREWNSLTPQMPLLLSSTRTSNLIFRSLV